MIKPVSSTILTRHDGTPVDLYDFYGKNVVLFSFPLNTTACAAQMTLIERVINRFRSANTVVLGVSNLRPALLRRYVQQYQLSYDLLTDSKGQILCFRDIRRGLPGGLVLPVAQAGFVLIDESGYVIESGAYADAETSVEKALRAVKIHAATCRQQVYG